MGQFVQVDTETLRCWFVGQIILIKKDVGDGHIVAEVTEYDSLLGKLTFEVINRSGIGEHSSWNISLTGEVGPIGPMGPTGPVGKESNSLANSFLITATNTIYGNAENVIDGDTGTYWETLVYYAGDDHWDKVKLLIQSGDLNNPTQFTDNSSSPHLISRHGDTTYTSAESKWEGGNSIYYDGDEDYLTLADSEDWYFGNEDFTIEGWVYLKGTLGNTFSVFNQGNAGASSDSSFNIWWDQYWRAGIYVSDGVTPAGWDEWNINTHEFLADTWYHIAAVRNGDILKLYVNGEATSETTLPNDWYIGDSTRALEIGDGMGGEYHYGYTDNLRITKGLARYTQDFTRPSEAFLTGVEVKNTPILKIDHGSNVQKTIHKYYFVINDGDSALAPNTWNFQASNDDASWETLDTRYNQSFSSGTYNYTFINTGSFRYYRMEFISGNSSTVKLSKMGFAGE
ncbi:hypothetical protein CL634_11475 [bacterium]|nr:hypothetical protein [bacterium]